MLTPSSSPSLLLALALTGCALTLGGCLSNGAEPGDSAPAGDSDEPTDPPPAGLRELPPPREQSATSLERSLADRHSVRSFTDEVLTEQEISQLLWSAQGINRSWGGRTAPSAGAKYPIELFLVTAAETLHYVPDGHRASQVATTDLRPALMAAGLDQMAIGDAPAVLVVTGVVARTAEKYGDRAERYVFMEAGHVAQNVLLQAVALGLGGVPIGAFTDAEVSQVLGLPDGQIPLYLIPVGHED